jgi:hypothetical protein
MHGLLVGDRVIWPALTANGEYLAAFSLGHSLATLEAGSHYRFLFVRHWLVLHLVTEGDYGLVGPAGIGIQ